MYFLTPLSNFALFQPQNLRFEILEILESGIFFLSISCIPECFSSVGNQYSSTPGTQSICLIFIGEVYVETVKDSIRAIPVVNMRSGGKWERYTLLEGRKGFSLGNRMKRLCAPPPVPDALDPKETLSHTTEFDHRSESRGNWSLSFHGTKSNARVRDTSAGVDTYSDCNHSLVWVLRFRCSI